jgi:hypothetical protein
MDGHRLQAFWSKPMTRDPIADFLAKGGKINSIPDGERSIDEREFRFRGDAFEARKIRERHVVVDSCGREHVRNGLGEWLS